MVLPRFLVSCARQVATYAHTVFAGWAAFFHAFGVHAAFVALDHFLGLGVRDLLYLFLVHD